MSTPSPDSIQRGLVLSGGGARGAYQAGVVQAAYEIAFAQGHERPFPVITGTSAGAINAAFLASHAHSREAARRLRELWESLEPNDIFKTNVFSLSKIGMGWFTDLSSGSLKKTRSVRGLLDTEPLRKLITRELKPGQIKANLESGDLEALAIAVTNYVDANGVIFVQSKKEHTPWNRTRRRSESAEITIEHVMASSAIPLFFPPVTVGSKYFGDGCMRNTAPLSAPIHLGCSRLLVVSVRREQAVAPEGAPLMVRPSLAQILSVVLNTLLMEPIDADLERLTRINHTIDLLKQAGHSTQLKKMEILWLSPSQDLGQLAREYDRKLPGVIRYLLAGMGSKNESAELASYLLFQSDYTKRLAEIGYQDAMGRKDEIIRFFSSAPIPGTESSPV